MSCEHAQIFGWNTVFNISVAATVPTPFCSHTLTYSHISEIIHNLANNAQLSASPCS